METEIGDDIGMWPDRLAFTRLTLQLLSDRPGSFIRGDLMVLVDFFALLAFSENILLDIPAFPWLGNGEHSVTCLVKSWQRFLGGLRLCYQTLARCCLRAECWRCSLSFLLDLGCGLQDSLRKDKGTL